MSWLTLGKEIEACIQCSRLVGWREEVARVKRKAYLDWEYWGKPVPGFGDHQARVLVMGLAPGAHGANRTGRMFTGDSSGDFLYPALHAAGFSNQPTSTHIEDGLVLNDLFLTSICRCVPPQNRPNANEIANCLPFATREINLLERVQVVVALGKIAFDGVIRLYRHLGHEIPKHTFSHQAKFRIGDPYPWLVASYHPSRQNTQTGRLTKEMFDNIWMEVNRLLEL
jgi:uracil-DNA glycosylase family 4